MLLMYKRPRIVQSCGGEFKGPETSEYVDGSGKGVDSCLPTLVMRVVCLLDVKTCNEVDLENSIDWEVKTITSALKQYLRYLLEHQPLNVTFSITSTIIFLLKPALPPGFLSGSRTDCTARAAVTKYHKPDGLKQQRFILSQFESVSNHSKQNLMTVANLGVVFGPTLMRPQEETVAAIMDLKFQNIVVEILIENHEKLFVPAKVDFTSESRLCYEEEYFC
ncbi:hypothetical protein J1605_010141 [Eschrichtius robustus]|uniref:Rho-GAP domain-containing protein n=1 Tax=Eschrichtius robustus TaxID=9764 RepID=A0AB34GQT3_ESCRO|nr:hypothetical protein J1605_010141 [Eschrichtius robustus]